MVDLHAFVRKKKKKKKRKTCFSNLIHMPHLTLYMQRHAEVNSNYFSSTDFDIINPDAHAFSQGHVMDIATKRVELCNIVGSTLCIT